MRYLFVYALVWAACCCSTAEPSQSVPLWNGHESVADYAKKVNLPPTRSIDLGGGVTLDLVLIPAGRFIMGTPEPSKPVITVSGAKRLWAVGWALIVLLLVFLIVTKRRGRPFTFSLTWLLLFTASGGLMVGGNARWRQALIDADRYDLDRANYIRSRNQRYALYELDKNRGNDIPAHLVTLSHPFYLGKYSVTQAQYKSITGRNPSYNQGSQLPVEMVSWNDAVAFCKALNERFPNDTLAARLPSEAQWEFACRAGTITQYYSGDQESALGEVAWYEKNSSFATHSVGEKKPNAFGLYDMHGNVWQWCADKFAANREAASPLDPLESDGPDRVHRGGSFSGEAGYCRSAFRAVLTPENAYFHVGFRIVMSAPQYKKPE